MNETRYQLFIYIDGWLHRATMPLTWRQLLKRVEDYVQHRGPGYTARAVRFEQLSYRPQL